MNTEAIVIFSPDWRLVGVVSLGDSGLQLHEESLTDVPEIAGILVSEAGPGVTIEQLRGRLKQVGVKAYIFNADLLALLREVSSQEFNPALRTQVVPDILGLDAEHARAALEAVLNAHGSI